MRSNISVAIVDMVKSNDSNSQNDSQVNCRCNTLINACTPGNFMKASDCKYCHSTNMKCQRNHYIFQSGEFDWSSSTQGLILSSFYWGYILPQIAAGRLADKFGPKYLLLAGGSLGAIMTLLAPVAARFHVGCLIATRAFCGLGLVRL